MPSLPSRRPASCASPRAIRRVRLPRSSTRSRPRSTPPAPGIGSSIAPGDYHERGDYTTHQPTDEAGAGVLITTPDIHLRGLDRNRVVVDGTKPGSPKCSSAAGDQDFGPNGLGRNGVEVFKADGVTVENLTACNFLSGSGGGGNQIWFNGGDGSGQVGMGPFRGDYLSATSTFYGGSGAPAGTYGIFTSNSRGPGVIDHSYASNMNDASYYIGACPDCNQVLTHAHAEGSALGYSGTNSGGHLVIKNSEWDLNNTGIVTNSQNNDDAPSPQVGLCPGSTTRSCTIFRNNYIHDNNNPNVPSAGSASLGPPGTGMVVSGGRFDTVNQNRVTDNGAWGILLVPFPDATPNPLDTPSHCQGGTLNFDRPGLLLRRLGQRGLRQLDERQRVLRQPDQRRPRRPLAAARSRQLLARQLPSRRQPGHQLARRPPGHPRDLRGAQPGRRPRSTRSRRR